MSNLDSFPPDLNPTKKQQISKIFASASTQLPTVYRSKSVQFIPFFQERDSMGRLLCHQNKSKTLYQDQIDISSSYFFRGDQNQIRNTINTRKMNKAIDSFFRKIDLQQKQLKRSTFSPKKIGLVYQKHIIPNNQQNAQEYDPVHTMDLIKKRVHSMRNKEKDESPSPYHNKNPTKQIQPVMKKTASCPPQLTKNNKKNRNQPHKRNKSNAIVKQTQENNKKVKTNILGGGLSLKIKQNVEHPELRRFRQMDKLAIKVIGDYQQGHVKFFQKMKQAKRTAHNIKKQLQLQ